MVKNEDLDNQLKALYKRKYHVTKHNLLIQKTTTNLTLNEQKFILIALSKIQKEDDVYKEYQISIKEFCAILNIKKDSGGYLNSRIKTYLKHLADNSLWFYDNIEKEDILIRWLANIKIKNSIISYSFDKSVAPFIFNLKNYYTNYELWNVLLLNSKNSIEFYEFMKSLSNLDLSPVFSVDNLMQKFSLNYKTYAEFKRSFLVKCINEINAKTDIKIEMKEIKNGRKIEKLEFNIKTLTDSNLVTQYLKIENSIQQKRILF